MSGDGQSETCCPDLWDRINELEAQLSTLKAQREWVSKSDAVAFEYQHEETGQIGYVDQWQVDNGFFENNPRLQLIGPLYRHPPAPEGE